MVSEKAKSNKRKKLECIISRLPRDLIEQVFLSLPVKTLLNCIGVCKQSRSIIRDPKFVTSHLQLAPHCALLFFPRELVSSCGLYPSEAILIDEAWSQSTWDVPVIGPDDFLCGSSNGLVCLYTHTTTIKIANLATGECLHLAKPAKNLTDDHFSFYSFGFHPLTKEYKVTHFLASSHETRIRAKVDSFDGVQVYTLGDEKWKYIGAPEALSLNCVKNSGVVNVDGTMYWLTEDQGASWHHAVMSFDLNKESFGRIQLPTAALEDSAFYGPRRYWIKEIDGKVCIATCQTSDNQPILLRGEIHIWALDINLEQKWIQKYIIQPSAQHIPGPNIVHRDKIVLQHDARNLCSYELLGKNVEVKLSNMEKLLDFSPRKPGSMQVYTFVKSLVRLDSYKKASIVRRPKRKEGWELKKWEALESQRRKIEDIWKKVLQSEQYSIVTTKNLRTTINRLMQRLPDDEALKCIGMKIDQMLHYLPEDCPNQHPRSLRRLNWVAQNQDMDNLEARVDKLNKLRHVMMSSGRQEVG
ncbi:F-box protein CPR1-like [Oryza glaberrima]|uniref:F-box protein CPR1-like n=1 Tax=Oryza glaberrima TaxID=4538 RepID=UPI00224C46AC|nr:F-box protein CPR1-like [Oryza glaberrima]